MTAAGSDVGVSMAVTRFEGASPVARYWLANCKGFAVKGDARGVVEDLIRDSETDPHVPSRLVVRTRSRRRRIVPARAVTLVVPAERTLVVTRPRRREDVERQPRLAPLARSARDRGGRTAAATAAAIRPHARSAAAAVAAAGPPARAASVAAARRVAALAVEVWARGKPAAVDLGRRTAASARGAARRAQPALPVVRASAAALGRELAGSARLAVRELPTLLPALARRAMSFRRRGSLMVMWVGKRWTRRSGPAQ
jgi:hypothetical protein